MKISPEELAQALKEKRPEMLRIISARLRYHGLEYEAEDIVQDGIVNLLEYELPIRPEEIAGLFHTTCGRLAYNRIGQVTNHARLDDEYTRIYQPDSQAHMKQREQLKVDVELALDKLDARTSQVVRLVWMEGRNWAQAAKALKCSKRDVHLSLGAALPILRLELARYDHRHRPASVEPQASVSASQAPYKEGVDETDSTMPLGGTG